MNKAQRKLLENVVIVEVKTGSVGVRTAIGKASVKREKGGYFKNTRPDDLAAFVIRRIIKLSQIDPGIVDDVVLGCAFPEGAQGINVTRVATIQAGVECGALDKFIKIPGRTINRFCASGLQAIVDGILQTATGIHSVVIAGGVESMSMVPMGGVGFSANPYLAKNYIDYYTNMGLTAETLAEMDDISREEQDEFALNSHRKAVKYIDSGIWKNEIEPYEVVEQTLEGENRHVANVDEGPRIDTTLEALAKLKPVFKKDGTVTAGNSSQMSDGAAAVMIMTLQKAHELGLKPVARLVSYQLAGVPPETMGFAPAKAIPKALKSAELTMDDIGIVELNEAFAAQALSALKRLRDEEGIEMPEEILNVLGGAIALGHPLGCTGAYLTIKGINEARRRSSQYAMVTMCIGGGMGAAGIFELLY